MRFPRFSRSLTDPSVTSTDTHSQIDDPCYLFENDDEFAMCLSTRVDEMYFAEQNLLWDAEVWNIGCVAAREIMEGGAVDAARSRATAAAWKLEVEAVQSLMVRYEARRKDGVEIETMRRSVKLQRELTNAKLLKRLASMEKRISRMPSSGFEEAEKLLSEMTAAIAGGNVEYDKIAERKTELTTIYYQLHSCLNELLRVRRDAVLPELNRVCKLFRRKTFYVGVSKASAAAVAVASVPLLCVVPPAGIACVGAYLAALLTTNTVSSVDHHRQAKSILDAFGADVDLSQQVQAVAKDLETQIQSSTPPKVSDLLRPRHKEVPNLSSSTRFSTSLGSGLSATTCVSFVPLLHAVAPVMAGATSVFSVVDVVSSVQTVQQQGEFLKACTEDMVKQNDMLQKTMDKISERCPLPPPPLPQPKTPRRPRRSF